MMFTLKLLLFIQQKYYLYIRILTKRFQESDVRDSNKILLLSQYNSLCGTFNVCINVT